ncbi:MAG: hypothetical protein E6Q97_00110 [Desulfurellales bacterium]|nr:MAG: hypothetical protein E6Q97_00110 [Desulfurellales bacterium]
MNTESARRLCAAVIEAAIEDYRMHVRHGRIKDGQLTTAQQTCYRNGSRQHEPDAKRLLHFFKKGGAMDAWIDVAGLEIDPNQIRNALKIQ